MQAAYVELHRLGHAHSVEAFDGAALLANDPFEGPSIPNGTITVPHVPGLGVRRRGASDGHG